MLTRVSVPGKLILMGEHAVVYGRPALVAATSLRLQVDLYSGRQSGVEVELTGMPCRGQLSWSEVSRYASEVRQRWESYEATPTPEEFARLHDDRADRLVLVALGEAIAALGEDPSAQGHPLSALRLRVDSAVPMAAGFGSSAATAVAVVTAVCTLLDESARWSLIGPMAGAVERRQHGAPSGVDVAAVFHGGLLRARRVGEELSIEPLPARTDTLRRLRVFDTGRSAESTGTVVAAVRSQRARHPGRFDASLDAAEAAALAFQAAVTGSADGVDLMAPIRQAQRYLELLEVVPEPVRDIVRAVEAVGGAAKISGSGSLSGPGAGSLLVLLPDDVEDLPGPLARLLEHEVELGAEGVRVEAVA